MREYKFEVRKTKGVYEIDDAIVGQNIFGGQPIVLPLGALVMFYKQLSAFCHGECIGGNSFYGNQRDLPYVYAVLRDNVCKEDTRKHTFFFDKSDMLGKWEYLVMHLILDGPTVKYYFPRKALLDLCVVLSMSLKSLDDPKIKVWADYVMNKMTEDVPLDFELFCKWITYVHHDCPSCYYEVWMDAYDRIDDRLTLRQNIDIAAAYIKDHEHDYD